MARFFAPDCWPVLGPVKARPCGRPAAGLDRSCAPAVIWRRRRIGAQQDQLNQSVHSSKGTPGTSDATAGLAGWRAVNIQLAQAGMADDTATGEEDRVMVLLALRLPSALGRAPGRRWPGLSQPREPP